MDNICIGTAQFGMKYGIANKNGKPDIDEVKRIVQAASKNHIYFYDTAASYGSSESVLGTVFSDLKITNEVKCITKLSPDFFFTPYDKLKNAVLKSLERLQIKSLWGLLTHRTKIKGDWKHFTKAVEKLKSENIIKNFGVSIYQPDDALRFSSKEHIDIIQVPFNILDRRLLENDFFNIALNNHKKVFIRSVFLQGLLLMDEKQLIYKKMQWALHYLSYFHEFIKKDGLESKVFALKMVWQYLPQTTVIIGLDSHDQLLANIKIVKSKPLSESIIKDWWTNLPDYPERLLNPSLW